MQLKQTLSTGGGRSRRRTRLSLYFPAIRELICDFTESQLDMLVSMPGFCGFSA